jgi:hypothetical protein
MNRRRYRRPRSTEGIRILDKPKKQVIPKTIWKQIDALLKRYDGHLEIDPGFLKGHWQGELRLGLTNPLGRPARSIVFYIMGDSSRERVAYRLLQDTKRWMANGGKPMKRGAGNGVAIDPDSVWTSKDMDTANEAEFRRRIGGAPQPQPLRRLRKEPPLLRVVKETRNW